MLRNISVVIIGNSNIEKDIQQNGKTKQRKIHAVIFIAHGILYSSVNAKNPKRFD